MRTWLARWLAGWASAIIRVRHPRAAPIQPSVHRPTRQCCCPTISNAGMEYFTSEQMSELLTSSRSTARFDPEVKAFVNVTSEGGAPDGKYINWLTIKDQAVSITEDVSRVAGHTLVAPGIPVHGYLYDVKSGLLKHVYTAVSGQQQTGAKGPNAASP